MEEVHFQSKEGRHGGIIVYILAEAGPSHHGTWEEEGLNLIKCGYCSRKRSMDVCMKHWPCALRGDVETSLVM